MNDNLCTKTFSSQELPQIDPNIVNSNTLLVPAATRTGCHRCVARRTLCTGAIALITRAEGAELRFWLRS